MKKDNLALDTSRHMPRILTYKEVLTLTKKGADEYTIHSYSVDASIALTTILESALGGCNPLTWGIFIRALNNYQNRYFDNLIGGIEGVEDEQLENGPFVFRQGVQYSVSEVVENTLTIDLESIQFTQYDRLPIICNTLNKRFAIDISPLEISNRFIEEIADLVINRLGISPKEQPEDYEAVMDDLIITFICILFPNKFVYQPIN